MVWAVALSTMELSPHCLTRRELRRVFVVWLGAVSSRPLTHPAPYPPASDPTAAPKGISGRTSYLRVRLVFHPYPQLIPRICNSGGSGPPRGFTRASPWPWIAHPVSGPPRATPCYGAPSSDSLSLRLPDSRQLTSPRTVTRRFILQ